MASAVPPHKTYMAKYTIPFEERYTETFAVEIEADSLAEAQKAFDYIMEEQDNGLYIREALCNENMRNRRHTPSGDPEVVRVEPVEGERYYPIASFVKEEAEEGFPECWVEA
ncbi:MAG TPA: hypothetical protein VN736_15080 [Candidatus Limnocylindrales bacterium]|jgi:hypothetical protein|nr:hypothetical protein [Candidatus Limnocylindrales bacterium]